MANDPLRAILMFHRGKDPARVSLRRVVKKLEKASIPHAIMGGMAVYVHGHRRLTEDVNVLLTPEGLQKFRELFVPGDYDCVSNRARRFVDKENQVTLDILVTGLYPGSGEPGPIRFPDPEAVRERIGKVWYIDLPTLVQLKLAARRHQDFADVVNLIAANGLDESFAQRLHPSVRRDYVECLEEKRRDDEYQARPD